MEVDTTLVNNMISTPLSVAQTAKMDRKTDFPDFKRKLTFEIPSSLEKKFKGSEKSNSNSLKRFYNFFKVIKNRNKYLKKLYLLKK